MSHDLHPVVVTVSQGETLYLPSYWFHHVTQSHSTIGNFNVLADSFSSSEFDSKNTHFNEDFLDCILFIIFIIIKARLIFNESKIDIEECEYFQP